MEEVDYENDSHEKDVANHNTIGVHYVCRHPAFKDMHAQAPEVASHACSRILTSRHHGKNEGRRAWVDSQQNKDQHRKSRNANVA